MPVLFNLDQVEPTAVTTGVTRRALITKERVNSDFIQLDHLTLQPGISTALEVSKTDLSWFQLLQGTATLNSPEKPHKLTTSNVTFLPPGFESSITTKEGTEILYGKVPRADRFDPNFQVSHLALRCVNWRKEPILDSEHDARKRIYLVTPTLFGTKAVKGEMIIYPPGTAASNHYHVGAEHFQYIISGSAKAYLGEETHTVRAGDTLYNYENEPHYFVNDGNEDMVFVEYFVPAECVTEWINPELVCAWLPTGKNIDGGVPARDIGAHSSAETVNPNGV